MNVVSYFDGMSCGQIALDNLGIKVDNYFAYEVDKNAIKVTLKNYPNTKQMGSVVEADLSLLPKVDLFIGGSPCQNLSNVNVYSKGKGLQGEKSVLFWEYVRLFKELKPKYFLLENVGSAKKEDVEIINKELGVCGVSYNSRRLTSQHRNRLYWTNIDFDKDYKEDVLSMKTLLEKEVDSKYYLSEKMKKYILSEGTKNWVSGKLEIDLDIARPLTATMHKMHRADTDNYVTGVAPIGKTKIRRLTPLECERLQTVPDGYTNCVSDTQRYMMLGNGWTVKVIEHIFKGLNVEPKIGGVGESFQLKFDL